MQQIHNKDFTLQKQHQGIITMGMYLASTLLLA